mmetsp:Transcript_9478/g.22401  ORF Transcript_9478/g.22401 Transcript_9478/m.22401 type:complete len:252 (-) Transcript_9478:591-1346(-)
MKHGSTCLSWHAARMQTVHNLGEVSILQHLCLSGLYLLWRLCLRPADQHESSACIGVVHLLQPKPDDRCQRHGEHSTGNAPNRTPESQCHDHDQGMQVQAMLHHLVLHDASKHIVDDERDNKNEDGLAERLVRVKENKWNRQELGNCSSNVRNEVQNKGENSEHEGEVHPHDGQAEAHGAADNGAGDGLPQQVALHQVLDAFGAPPLLMRTRHQGIQAEEKHQRCKNYAFCEGDHGIQRVQKLPSERCPNA